MTGYETASTQETVDILRKITMILVIMILKTDRIYLKTC